MWQQTCLLLHLGVGVDVAAASSPSSASLHPSLPMLCAVAPASLQHLAFLHVLLPFCGFAVEPAPAPAPVSHWYQLAQQLRSFQSAVTAAGHSLPL